jgi:hypothetical protein
VTAFYTAAEARTASIGRGEIRDEINRIESAIMEAVSDGGALEVTVGPGSTVPIVTGFTVDSTYYNAWKETQTVTDEFRVCRRQMDEVIGHFARMGYNIVRAQHQTSSTFNWVVKW